MYQELVDYINNSDIKDSVELSFIDLMENDIDSYPAILQLLNRGFSPPVISIGNQKYLYGGISKVQIQKAAKEVLGK